MPSGIPIDISGGTGLLTADANGNAKINLPVAAAQAGYSLLAADLNPNGTKQVIAAQISSADRRLSVGTDNILFDYSFNAAAQNTNIWRSTTSTMTMSSAAGGLLLNAALSNSALAACSLTTWQTFVLNGAAPLTVDFTAYPTDTIVANQEVYLGFLPWTSSPQTVPADGACFRYTVNGLEGLVIVNGTTTTSVLMSVATMGVNQARAFRIVYDERSVQFWVDGVLLATINTPAGFGSPGLTTSYSVQVCMRNAALVSGTQTQWKVQEVTVMQKGVFRGTPLPVQQALQGLHGNRAQDGATQGLTGLNLTNAGASPAAVVLTNTTVAAGAGLGGVMRISPTLAVGTYGIVFSYANPQGTVAQTPRQLVIYGLRLTSFVRTILTGGNVTYAWRLAYGHSALSLVTAESASFAATATKVPNFVPLGYDNYPAAAAAGFLGQTHVVTFRTPIVVNPGEFIALTANNLGVVTTAGDIEVSLAYDAHWF